MNDRLQYNNPQKIFFTSDLHFDHKNIIKFTNRPCKNIEEMNELIIHNWNLKIPEDGITFILGDIFFGKKCEKLKEIINRLNGVKYLILGNHDNFSKDKYRESGISDIFIYKEIVIKDEDVKQLIILSHYPMITWNQVHHDSWMLYGHVHGTYEFMEQERKKLHNINKFIGLKTTDVGIDIGSNLSPFSYYEIKNKMNELTEI